MSWLDLDIDETLSFNLSPRIDSFELLFDSSSFSQFILLFYSIGVIV